MTENAVSHNSLATESLLFAGRLLKHWWREPVVLVQAVLFPTFLLITYNLLVGKSLMRITGADSLYGLVPTCAVAGALFGSLAAGLSIPFERDSGLLSQFWVLPVHRSSALTGRLLAEAGRTLAATALITAVGVGLGLRFDGNLLAIIPFLLVPVLVVAVFSMAVMAVTMRAKSGTALIWLGVPVIGAVFASSGAPPIALLPAWIRPLVQYQPMSPVIESMRALAEGTSATWPLLLSVVWAIVLAAVFGPLAVRGYRAAAESGS
jgi:ABC-2 type transport system permease protein